MFCFRSNVKASRFAPLFGLSPDRSPGRAGSGRAGKRRYVRFTRWRRRRFFALLAESGNVRAACELSGVGLGCIYRLRRTEPGFVAAMAAAKAEADAHLGRGGAGDAMDAELAHPRPLPPAGGEDSGAFDDLVIRRGVGGRLRRMAAGTIGGRRGTMRCFLGTSG